MLDFQTQRDKLNANQRAAVDSASGRLLVLAGPGSGKTHVLTLRIARLIEDTPESSFRVLALTFTAKAAAEMRQRVEDMLAGESRRTFITTFHSFCADVLRQHGSHIGIRPDFLILNQQEDRAAVLVDAINAVASPSLDPARDSRLLPAIDYLFDNLLDESQVTEVVKDPSVASRVGVLYRAYREQLVAANRLDFPSLLWFGNRLLASNKAVAAQVRLVYPHIFVDEFQDTNYAQYKLLRAVVGPDPSDLFVVADDDQIIYQWNGASPERLTELQLDYQMEVLQLPGNYRCPPEVIAVANRLISHNPNRSAAKLPLIAMKPSAGQDVIRIRHFANVEAELNWIALDLKTRPGHARAESVVLARTRKVIEEVYRQLDLNGVPASLALRKFEFESAPLKWLHAMLRLADGRGEKEQLRRVCRAFYELEGLDVRPEDVSVAAAAMNGDLLRAWFVATLDRQELSPVTQRFLLGAQDKIVDRLLFLPFIDSAFEWFGQVADMSAVDVTRETFADYPDELAAFSELLTQVRSTYGDDKLTLHALLHEFDLVPKAMPVPPNAVRCLTIHNAKGMEFDHVYLAGLVEDQLPSYQSIQKGPASLEMLEERRNCFVAITRTQATLTLTFADSYFGWRKQPSRFLTNMGFEPGAIPLS